MIKTRNLLLKYFSVDDLRDLAFQMGIYPDRFPQTLGPFARELVLYVQRNNLWPAFIREAKEMRPKVDWSYLEKQHAPQTEAAPVDGGDQCPHHAPGAAGPVNLHQEANYLSNMLASLPDWEDEDERRTLLVVNGLQALERAVDLTGTRHEAAARLMAALLRFADTDPGFVAFNLAQLYEAVIATGLFSQNRRQFLQQKIQLLRGRN